MSREQRRYVRVQEDRLRELEQQDSRLRSVQRDLPNRLNAIQEQARRELQQRMAPLEERAKRQEQATQSLRTNLRDLERQTQKRFQQQRRDLQKSISAAERRQQQTLKSEVSRLESAMDAGFTQQRHEYLQLLSQQRQEYLDIFEQQDEKFTNLIAQEREARQQGQKILQQQIDRVVEDIEAERERKQQIAADLLADVEQIWQDIDRDYQHQRFAPGRLADLRRGIEMARSNLQGGVSEAAIATSQNTYLELADLRLELERKEQEWQLLYNATLTDLVSLIEEVRTNRECELEVGQGSEADKFQFEVDYWTDGRLSEYERQLQQLEERLKAEESSLTAEQVQELGGQIQALQPQLGEIVQQAKQSILGSQMRVEIADRVVETLSKMGYSLVDSDGDAVYEADDERNAFAVKVKNMAGDEVVTVISPAKEWGTNSISINTFSPTLVDERAAEDNARAIFDSLENEGIQPQGNDFECNAQAREDYRDLQQVRQRSQTETRSQSAEG